MQGLDAIFLLAPVPGEVAGAAGAVLVSACGALWKRAQTLQDRQTARDDANLTRVIDVVERVTRALDENTNAIREANHAGG